MLKLIAKAGRLKQFSPQRDKIKVEYLGFSKRGKEDKKGGRE